MNTDKQFDYKFERIDAGLFGMQKAEKDYRNVILSHGREGWRLVQVFAPVGQGMAGPKYYEMIFERELSLR